MPVSRHLVGVVIDRPSQLWFVAGRRRNLGRLGISAVFGCGGVIGAH
jgi:hypothetical protein